MLSSTSLSSNNIKYAAILQLRLVTLQPTVVKNSTLLVNLELLLIYFSIHILCYSTVLLIHLSISEAFIVSFTPLHLSDSFSYFGVQDVKCRTSYSFMIITEYNLCRPLLWHSEMSSVSALLFHILREHRENPENQSAHLVFSQTDFITAPRRALGPWLTISESTHHILKQTSDETGIESPTSQYRTA